MTKSANKQKESFLLAVLRILLGAVFIFSSLVKGVDPMGTMYRVEDYLDAYSLYALYDYAFILGVFLIITEFVLGVAMLFRLQPKLASLGVFLIMIIFTLLTFFDALYLLVPDCGCFGDAIKLSNWGTFYKNVVLIIMAAYLFVFRKHIPSKLPIVSQYTFLLLATLLMGWFNYYNVAHLPMIDFRDWKIGNDMRSSGLDKAKTYVSYQNNETAEIKEFLSPNYPWNDSIWMSQWSFLAQRIDESEVIRKHALIIEDAEGNNLTEELVGYPGYQFLLISPDLELANSAGMLKASAFFNKLIETDAGFALITSSGADIIEDYEARYGIEYDAYLGDDIELKAMIRSNPGLVLLYDGVVIDKWHFNDFPEPEEAERLLAGHIVQ